ncbi:MAG TPA: sugar transferase [Oceanobacillus sp.]|nr:sugar transferase [Oceanobacillus sp.]
MKRLFDVMVSGIGLIVLSPLLLAIGLAVRLTSPGPALYKAKRVGRDGELFTLYKFRSMVADADKQGPGVTTAGDSRVTPVGRILRRTKLDELPQLFNVLRGDMSLVGPRPEDPRYVALYTPEQRAVLRVRPGITSPASVHYRDEERILQGENWETQYMTQVLPAKLALDLEYAQEANLLTDLKIILQTAKALFR